jgi:hypothetical protein
MMVYTFTRLNSRLMFRLVLLTVIFFLSCGEQGPDFPTVNAGPTTNSSASTDNEIRILFIGNSLTYTNDLPAMVAQIGKLDGVEIGYKSIVTGGYSLEDHWKEGYAQQNITSGNYDFVVLQQGPSALPESQALLRTYVEKFVAVAKGTKTKTLLYMVWPSGDRSFDLDNVIYSYTQAAANTGSLLAPAGLAWKNAWKINSALTLYGGDNFHPSVMGSLLAALTVYGTIANKTKFDFIDYTKSPWNLDVEKADFELLRQAASTAMTK